MEHHLHDVNWRGVFVQMSGSFSRKIETVGVIGAGVMGSGVAQNLAQTGHSVVLLDISEDILATAMLEIRKSLRFHKMLGSDPSPEGPDKIFQRIVCTTDYEMLEPVDYVIENATEKWEVKEEIYGRIDQICRRNCVFAANTSAIPIARIAAATQRPEQVIGLHFMNPVPMKKAVEVIRGRQTSARTVEIAKTVLEQMGKEAIVVNDSPGFVSNRVLMLTINEAICLVQENVATAEDIDKIFRLCFGHKMGPLETADLIGLDTVLYSTEVLRENFKDSKYEPCQLLKEMVDQGLCGRKSGEGFYKYS